MSSPEATVNTFARLVRGWLERAFPSWEAFVEQRKDGELEVAVPAPPKSRAGHLRVFTSRGDLWVRFDPPRMCYPIDSREELLSIVRQLMKDQVLFVNIYRGSKWVAGTLTKRGVPPQLSAGERAEVVSWTGKYDEALGAMGKRSNRRAG